MTLSVHRLWMGTGLLLLRGVAAAATEDVAAEPVPGGTEVRSSPIFKISPALPPREQMSARAFPSPRTRMQRQLTVLVHRDAMHKASNSPRVETAASSDIVVEDSVVLDPVVVTAPPEIVLMPPETKFQKFLRTGKIWERVGRKFTGEFGLRPDKGLFFSLSW